MQVFYYDNFCGSDDRVSNIVGAINAICDQHLIKGDRDIYLISDNNQLNKKIRQKLQDSFIFPPQVMNPQQYIEQKFEFLSPLSPIRNQNLFNLLLDSFAKSEDKDRIKYLIQNFVSLYSSSYLTDKNIKNSDLASYKAFISYCEDKGFFLPFEVLDKIEIFDNEILIYLPNITSSSCFIDYLSSIKEKENICLLLPLPYDQSSSPIKNQMIDQGYDSMRKNFEKITPLSMGLCNQFSGHEDLNMSLDIQEILKELYTGNCKPVSKNEQNIFFYFSHGPEAYSSVVPRLISQIIDNSKEETNTVNLITNNYYLAQRITEEIEILKQINKSTYFDLENMFEDSAQRSYLKKFIYALSDYCAHENSSSLLDLLFIHSSFAQENRVQAYKILKHYKYLDKFANSDVESAIKEELPNLYTYISNYRDLSIAKVSRETCLGFINLLDLLHSEYSRSLIDSMLVSLYAREFEALGNALPPDTDLYFNERFVYDLFRFSTLALKTDEQSLQDFDPSTFNRKIHIRICSPYQAKDLSADLVIMFDLNSQEYPAFKAETAFELYKQAYALRQGAPFYESRREEFYQIIASAQKSFAAVKLSQDRNGGELQNSPLLSELLDLFSSEDRDEDIPKALLELNEETSAFDNPEDSCTSELGGKNWIKDGYINFIYEDHIEDFAPSLSFEARNRRVNACLEGGAEINAN